MTTWKFWKKMPLTYNHHERYIDGVSCRRLTQKNVLGGDVYHCLKSTDDAFDKFGEAYFSFVEKGFVKAWKCHDVMTVNLVVPHGAVKIVVCDRNQSSDTAGYINSFILSPSNYCLLTIRFGLWFGFQGLGERANIILNIADTEHHPTEQRKAPMNFIKYDWSFEEDIK